MSCNYAVQTHLRAAALTDKWAVKAIMEQLSHKSVEERGRVEARRQQTWLVFHTFTPPSNPLLGNSKQNQLLSVIIMQLSITSVQQWALRRKCSTQCVTGRVPERRLLGPCPQQTNVPDISWLIPFFQGLYWFIQEGLLTFPLPC